MNGIHEARGSIPLSSTTFFKKNRGPTRLPIFFMVRINPNLKE